MADYQKMYYILCDAASKALDVLPLRVENAEAIKLLREALLEAENIYIDTADK